jgi:hypothetical protein
MASPALRTEQAITFNPIYNINSRLTKGTAYALVYDRPTDLPIGDTGTALLTADVQKYLDEGYIQTEVSVAYDLRFFNSLNQEITPALIYPGIQSTTFGYAAGLRSVMGIKFEKGPVPDETGQLIHSSSIQAKGQRHGSISFELGAPRTNILAFFITPTPDNDFAYCTGRLSVLFTMMGTPPSGSPS